MRFALILHESLPRLAWCAHLRRDSEVVEVHHGPWVETRSDWFVEGAWTGPFADGGFAEADHLVGTGGRAERDYVLFCAPHNLCDRIQSLRTGDDLYFSNSIPFLLQITGDAPDPRYTDYAIDRLYQQGLGLLEPDKRVPTARGRQIRLHEFCNVAVGADLSIRRLEKPAAPAPADFAAYRGQLEAIIAAIQANAADAGRRHRYRPVATVSRGYDANALAAIMSRHGASEAITFTNTAEDDGTAVAERLGYTVTGYDNLGYRHRPGVPEAEFYAAHWGFDVVMSTCEEQLVGALLVTGRRGGRVFTCNAPASPRFFDPRLSSLAGSTLAEFRLRVGFQHLVPYYAAGVHPDAVYRISVSTEMQPWSIGGRYDRPILRRIIEEAGVPRKWFGWKKLMSAHYEMWTPDDLTAESAADFTAYLRTLPKVPLRRRLSDRSLAILHRQALKANRVRRAVYRTIGRRPAADAPGQHRRALAQRPVFPMTLAFHWGCARVQPRYRLGDAPGPSASI